MHNVPAIWAVLFVVPWSILFLTTPVDVFDTYRWNDEGSSWATE